MPDTAWKVGDKVRFGRHTAEITSLSPCDRYAKITGRTMRDYYVPTSELRVYQLKQPATFRQCTYIIPRTGERCMARAMRGHAHCYVHSGFP